MKSSGQYTSTGEGGKSPDSPIRFLVILRFTLALCLIGTAVMLVISTHRKLSSGSSLAGLGLACSAMFLFLSHVVILRIRRGIAIPSVVIVIVKFGAFASLFGLVVLITEL